MNEISTKKCFKESIKKIWEDPTLKKYDNPVFKDILERGVVLQDKVIKNSILFIGINPSFNKGKGLVNNDFNSDNDGFYNNDDGHIDRNSYFKKFREISKEVDSNWAHTDLLFFRETNQKFVNQLLNLDIGKEFIKKQLEISKQIIIQTKPKLIIVSNALARDLMGVFIKDDENIEIREPSMQFKFKFDDDLGTHKIINQKELENIPIFFTSMLTGQRALDLGSYKRLLWHIKYVLKSS